MLEDGFSVKMEKFDQTTKEKPKDDPVGRFLERFGEALDIEHAVSGKVVPSYLSPAQKAESIKAIFRSVSVMAGKKLKQFAQGQLEQKEIYKLRLSIGILNELYKDQSAREKYIENRRRIVREIKTVNGERGKYKILRREMGQAQNASDEQARLIFSQRGARMNEVDLLLFEASKEELKEKQKELKKITEENPELGALAQYENLKDYARQLREEKFIWVPSRQALLDEIEEASFSGQPVLLSGESGTGKTRLVEQAALKLTGQINNETSGKDVRFQELIAKPKISSDGATYYEYKEIGEAATGRSSTLEPEPQHKGRIVADDEFNLLGESEQTERLARIAAWTPGKPVRMPVTNQEVRIADNFLYCAMVNLASERYTRKKIPPEVLRKFAKVDVDYPRQTEAEPEIYEMMLAALMDENGGIRVAREDLAPDFDFREEPKITKKEGQEVNQTVRIRDLIVQKDEGGKNVMAGGFLWRLAGALNEINNSFSHKEETILKEKGVGRFLKDMIIDIGTVLGWMKEYSTVGRSKDLEEFFREKMQKQFLSREAYAEEDRELVGEFLGHYGIKMDKKEDEKPEDREKKKEEWKAKEFEPMTPLEIGLLSPRVKYKKLVNKEPELSESFYVSSEGKTIRFKTERFEQDGREFVPGEVCVVTKTDGKKHACKFLGVNKENGLPVVVPYREEEGEKHLNEAVPSNLKTKWQNPETGQDQSIEINLEDELEAQKQFYKDKLNLDLDESKVKEIWSKHYAEIKSEIETYGYDKILIIPDNLPDAGTLNEKLIKTMQEEVDENGKKIMKPVADTYESSNFTSGGSFAGLKNTEKPGYRIVLVHSEQNIHENPTTNPFLKATLDKNILDLTGLDQKEIEKRIAAGQELPVNFETEINGQEFKIKAEGLSLGEYEVFQRMYFEKDKKHLDEKGWAWLLKSFSGPRVVVAVWSSGDRQLDVFAYDPSYADGYLGLRLSRSFSN